MAKFEQRDNSGGIFKNERREKDSHPHYTGSCMVDGVEYWISAWVKEGRDQNKFLSMAFNRKEGGLKQKQGASPLNSDEDIPF